MSRISIVLEYIEFLKREKKYWMIPIALIFLLIGALAVVLEGSAVAPFIYAIF